MEKKIKTYIIIAVVLIVVGLLAYNYVGGASNNPAMDNQPVSQSQISTLYSIATNQSLANKIGTGIIAAYPTKINGTAIVQNGKPTVLYIGAEYCPYCAATRWEMIIALMRFGNFTGLHYMTSSSDDIYPSAPTFTFYNSSYSSQYLTFISVETETNTGTLLQTPNAWENATYGAYDQGGIPFIDFGNKS